LKLREAQTEVKREIEAYRAEREARLRTQQPEAAALELKVARATADTDRCVVFVSPPRGGSPSGRGAVGGRGAGEGQGGRARGMSARSEG